jgi:polysaccharide biosynthesis/export protein
MPASGPRPEGGRAVPRRSLVPAALAAFALLAACSPVTPHYGPAGAGYRMGPAGQHVAANPPAPAPRPVTRSVARAATPPRVVEAPPPAPTPAFAPTNFRFVFQVGDELGVSVWKEKELDIVQRVQRDGTISPMLLGTLPVVGRSVDDVRTELEKRYTEYLQDPKVSVRVVSVFSERAYVLGEVKDPAAVPLVGPTSLLQVLAQAGGLEQETADQKRVRIVRMSADGRPTLISANVAMMLAGRQPAPDILPGDVIYVAPTGLADWSRGMTQALGPLSNVIGTAGSIVTSVAAIKALEND